MACAASPMHSRPSRCQHRSRFSCTVRILIWSQLWTSSTRPSRKGAIRRRLWRNWSSPALLISSNDPLGTTSPGLKVVRAVNQKQQPAIVELSEHLPRVARIATEPEPQHIHRRTEFQQFQSTGTARHRMASIAAHHQVGTDLYRVSVRTQRPDSRDAVLFQNQTGDLVVHTQVEARIPPGPLREEIQEIPLRHECHEFASRRDMPEIGASKCKIAENPARRFRLLVRQFEEIVQQIQFVQHLQSGRMNRIAAEIPEKIGVLLQHRDPNALARQQVSQHHPCRSAAHYATSRFDRHACILAWPRRLSQMLMCRNAQFDSYSRNPPPHAPRLSSGRLCGLRVVVGRSVRDALHRREAALARRILGASFALCRPLVAAGIRVLGGGRKSHRSVCRRTRFRPVETRNPARHRGAGSRLGAGHRGPRKRLCHGSSPGGPGLGGPPFSKAAHRLSDPPGQSGLHPGGGKVRLPRIAHASTTGAR